MLTIIPHHDVEELPEFFGFVSSSGDYKETLCGYVTRNLEGNLWLDYSPLRIYRLVYRRGENGSDGTLPPTYALHRGGHNSAKREERRLMTTEEGRQRYSLKTY